MAAVRGMALSRYLTRRCVRLWRTRYLSTVPEYDSSLSEKHYPEHIVNIVDQISQLTLVETAELNELLKIKLKIPDAPMMAMGAVPMAQAADQSEATDEPKEVQTEFTVKLTAFDDSGKVKLIKEIKSIVEGLNLVQAKKFVESVPQVVKENISKEDAEKLKTQIEAVGGTVEIE